MVVALDVVLGEAPLTDLSIARAFKGLAQRLPPRKLAHEKSITTRSAHDEPCTASAPGEGTFGLENTPPSPCDADFAGRNDTYTTLDRDSETH
jgi:hypothetical protein